MNFDLENIVTPVKVHELVHLLESYGYDSQETQYLKDGFTHGFDVGYNGPMERQSQSHNLPLRVGSLTELWNKLMKEVKLGRVAGPYDEIPFDNYIQSPIGLVPKAGNKTHLIFHLSYDFDQNNNRSLNHYTLRELCSVKYKDLDHAVSAYLKIARINKTASEFIGDNKGEENQDKLMDNGGKTYVQSAFRLIPFKPESWKWLIMKARDPKSGKWKFFIDKCLPFGASISCAIFKRFSNALKFLIEKRSKVETDTVTNYLDDFLFLALTLWKCNYLISEFLDMCEQIGVPISTEKTEMANEYVIFLGILLDGKNLMLHIPMEKREKVIKMLRNFISKRKTMIKDVQELCGYLNFLCKAIFPGRPFLHHMYAKYSKYAPIPAHKREVKNWESRILKPHHHI